MHASQFTTICGIWARMFCYLVASWCILGFTVSGNGIRCLSGLVLGSSFTTGGVVILPGGDHTPLRVSAPAVSPNDFDTILRNSTPAEFPNSTVRILLSCCSGTLERTGLETADASELLPSGESFPQLLHGVARGGGGARPVSWRWRTTAPAPAQQTILVEDCTNHLGAGLLWRAYGTEIHLDGVDYARYDIRTLPAGYARAPFMLREDRFPAYAAAGTLGKRMVNGAPEGYAAVLARDGKNTSMSADDSLHRTLRPLSAWMLYGPLNHNVTGVISYLREDDELWMIAGRTKGNMGGHKSCNSSA
ncbi:hypothetical protein VTK56DRAFT_896 [Thermocarpiscus australiensis]